LLTQTSREPDSATVARYDEAYAAWRTLVRSDVVRREAPVAGVPVHV
jgi:hypothetical protein